MVFRQQMVNAGVHQRFRSWRYDYFPCSQPLNNSKRVQFLFFLRIIFKAARKIKKSLSSITLCCGWSRVAVLYFSIKKLNGNPFMSPGIGAVTELFQITESPSSGFWDMRGNPAC